MRHPLRSPAGLAVAVLVVTLATLPARAGSIVGEWKLVEQTYGDGASNLVAPEAEPLRIEFVRRGTEIDGALRAGGHKADALSWPRLVADDSRPIEVRERRVLGAEDRIVVRYRVAPSPGDDLVLEVTEDYRALADGRTLEGTVLVRFERAGEDKGSYVLHRRFERVP